MKKVTTVYWLLPAKPERDLFCEVVRILRKEFRAPNFEPHLTLFSVSKDRQPPKKVLRQISSRRIRLGTRGVGFSSEFTKTLFVRFNSSDALRNRRFGNKESPGDFCDAEPSQLLFQSADPERRLSGDGQLEHLAALIEGRQRQTLLVRRLSAGHEPDLVQPRLLTAPPFPARLLQR